MEGNNDSDPVDEVYKEKSPSWFFFIPEAWRVSRNARLSLLQILPVMDGKEVAVVNGPVEGDEMRTNNIHWVISQAWLQNNQNHFIIDLSFSLFTI